MESDHSHGGRRSGSLFEMTSWNKFPQRDIFQTETKPRCRSGNLEVSGEFLTSRDSFLEVLLYAAEGREILQITTLLDRTADTVLLLATASHRNTFDTLWASGDAQIHTRRLTRAKLPHCSIAACYVVRGTVA